VDAPSGGDPIMELETEITNLRNRVKDFTVKVEAINKMDGAVREAAMMPYLQKAVQACQPLAVKMILKRLSDSGVKTIHGDLKKALNSVRLELKFVIGKGANLTLVVPPGLPDSMYKRIWSLDKGFTTIHGKSKPWKCFTLSTSEKKVLGAKIVELAQLYMRS
jgi:hypothetical protein